MKYYLSFIISVLLLMLSFTMAKGQTVIINEVMASNASTIADEDGDYEDWIELYNHGSETINLNGFGLSDDYDEAFRWYFPDIDITPGEFLLVWASGKNRKDPAKPLHTIFSISSEGEELLLTAPDGARLDELTPRLIPTDISVGRLPDDQSSWYYFDDPTPGSPNTHEAWSDILPAPVFSHPGGFYENELLLELSVSVDDASIYYTLDGSEPDPENLDCSVFQYKNQYPENPGDPFGPLLERAFQTHLYSEAIVISDQLFAPDPIYGINTSFTAQPLEPEGDVLKGTVLRARVFKDGYLPGPVVTHTYLSGEGIRDRFDLPVVMLTLPDSVLFDYYRGIYVAGQEFDNWREQNPDQDVWPGAPANWDHSGPEWERSMHLELFDQDGNIGFRQGLGLRIHGGWSRSNPKKSLRLYARNVYDLENDIDYKFFPDHGRPLDGEPTNLFKRIILRAGGNDSDMIRDAAAQKLMENTGIGIQRTRPAVHFINGVYWGIANIRDRQDRYHIAYDYDIDPDNVIIIDAPYDHIGLSQLEEGKPEDIPFFNDFFDFVTVENMAEESNYRLLKEWIDIDSYIDYYVMFIYLTANDWGGHDYPGAKHFRFWRVRETSQKPYQDGKWRVMVWDLDGALSNFNRALLTTVMDPDNKPSRMLFSMMENEGFKHRFINRFADLMNTRFLTEYALEVIDSCHEEIQSEIQHDEARWSRNPVSGYHHMRNFSIHRPHVQRQEIMDVFNLADTSYVTLRTNPSQGHIRINTIDIVADTPGVNDPAEWTGIYYQGLPIDLEAVPGPGMVFSHWDGLPEGTPARTSINLQDDIIITAHFKNAILHYWHFNHLSEEDYFETVNADYSVFPNHAKISYPGYGPGYMDRSDGTLLNAHMGEDAGYGLRVRNPSSTRELLFNVPSQGFHQLEFSYAVHRTNNGAREQALYYSPDKGQSWQQIRSGIETTTDYEVHYFDLGDYGDISDNPDLMMRILFTDEAAGNTSGNNRFDNVVMKVAQLHLDTLNPPPGIAGMEYEHWFSAQNGEQPYKFELTRGLLPDGLSLSGDGLLFGVPEKPGTYSFEVEVVDDTGDYESHRFMMTVFEQRLIHYWHFNDLPDAEFEILEADHSVLERGELSYFGSGDGYMDRTEGSNLNTWQGVMAGHGLRVRNPSAMRQLRFHVPSTNYRYLQFGFAVHRTNNGAQWQQLQYSTDEGMSWKDLGDSYRITTDYNVKTFDLIDIQETWDNPMLMMRILFLGAEASNTSGNNRFDNIALWGVERQAGTEPEALFIFPNPPTDGIIHFPQSHTVWLYDVMGREVLHQQNTNKIILTSLPSGLYIIVTEDGKRGKIILP